MSIDHKRLEEFLPLGEFCKENCSNGFKIIQYNFAIKNFGSIDAQIKNCRDHCQAYHYKGYIDTEVKSP